MVLTGRTGGLRGGGQDYVVSVKLERGQSMVSLPQIQGPQDPTRPLVVIDPGHGGRDPGAGSGPTKEKQLTLAIALALRDDLLRSGGVRVALTRSDDRFLALGERSAIARKMGADLFISIHADSTEVEAGAVGASVYTLSAKGSSEVAERMAARENAVDLIGGVPIRQQDDTVSAILVDLSQRKTQGQSEEFARLILREARGKVPFKDSTFQSAAFAVLKSPELPSVLLESGYINHPSDLARLTSREGQLALAEVVGQAIRVFFARNNQTVAAL
ncbi:N-acetylmuramoyl-L-alanine amidase family protein [Novosphingobium sp. NPDC080210]|uniref:N-acetylmuramoyl-L-alanine amidase family protein n=1 Tax=Novosphingobium sp. NPDC080210 TaxID=3390596 RepID=UPI003CFF28DC